MTSSLWVVICLVSATSYYTARDFVWHALGRHLPRLRDARRRRALHVRRDGAHERRVLRFLFRFGSCWIALHGAPSGWWMAARAIWYGTVE